ncbi:MAG TPA: hypothetical protein VKB26_04775 [Candidatus Acidoferrales bacterium]|nr:hypothetical protein [Candidatus Acidoferrales bacterium]
MIRQFAVWHPAALILLITGTVLIPHAASRATAQQQGAQTLQQVADTAIKTSLANHETPDQALQDARNAVSTADINAMYEGLKAQENAVQAAAVANGIGVPPSATPEQASLIQYGISIANGRTPAQAQQDAAGAAGNADLDANSARDQAAGQAAANIYNATQSTSATNIQFNPAEVLPHSSEPVDFSSLPPGETGVRSEYDGSLTTIDPAGNVFHWYIDPNKGLQVIALVIVGSGPQPIAPSDKNGNSGNAQAGGKSQGGATGKTGASGLSPTEITNDEKSTAVKSASSPRYFEFKFHHTTPNLEAAGAAAVAQEALGKAFVSSVFLGNELRSNPTATLRAEFNSSTQMVFKAWDQEQECLNGSPNCQSGNSASPFTYTFVLQQEPGNPSAAIGSPAGAPHGITYTCLPFSQGSLTGHWQCFNFLQDSAPSLILNGINVNDFNLAHFECFGLGSGSQLNGLTCDSPGGSTARLDFSPKLSWDLGVTNRIRFSGFSSYNPSADVTGASPTGANPSSTLTSQKIPFRLTLPKGHQFKFLYSPPPNSTTGTLATGTSNQSRKHQFNYMTFAAHYTWSHPSDVSPVPDYASLMSAPTDVPNALTATGPTGGQVQYGGFLFHSLPNQGVLVIPNISAPSNSETNFNFDFSSILPKSDVAPNSGSWLSVTGSVTDANNPGNTEAVQFCNDASGTSCYSSLQFTQNNQQQWIGLNFGPSSTPNSINGGTPGGSASVAGGTTGGSGTPGNVFNCFASVAVSPMLRSEGSSTDLGDIILNCSPRPGETNSPSGAIPSTGSITLKFNPNAPFAVPNLQGIRLFTGSSVSGSPAAGTGTQQPNVFQGEVSGNQVTFVGIPTLAPVTSGASRIYRITNIRANVNGTGGAALKPVQVQITGSPNFLIDPSSFTHLSPLSGIQFVDTLPAGVTAGTTVTTPSGVNPDVTLSATVTPPSGTTATPPNGSVTFTNNMGPAGGASNPATGGGIFLPPSVLSLTSANSLLGVTNTAVDVAISIDNQRITIRVTKKKNARNNLLDRPDWSAHNDSRVRSDARMRLASFSLRSPLMDFSPGALMNSFTNSFAHGSSGAADLSKALYSIVANGKSSGFAAELQFFDPTGRIQDPELPEGTILEPVKLGAAKSVAELKPGANVIRKPLEAYCVDYLKPPPANGMLYRIVSADEQAKYGDLSSVLQAGRELDEENAYTSDSNPEIYKVFIQQYALWAVIQQWNQDQFAEVFRDKTKANAAAARVPWTQQMDQSLTKLVPGRWRDIMLVKERAAEIAKRRQAQDPKNHQ